jgi:hypothetical protein
MNVGVIGTSKISDTSITYVRRYHGPGAARNFARAVTNIIPLRQTVADLGRDMVGSANRVVPLRGQETGWSALACDSWGLEEEQALSYICLLSHHSP